MQDKFYKIIANMLELADEMDSRITRIEKALEVRPNTNLKMEKLKALSEDKIAS